MPPFLKTQRLVALPAMERKDTRSWKKEGTVMTVDFEIKGQNRNILRHSKPKNFIFFILMATMTISRIQV